MPLILQKALPENTNQRVEVQWASYVDDPILPSLMPGVSHEDKVAFFAEEARKDFGNPSIRDLEVVDTDTGLVYSSKNRPRN